MINQDKVYDTVKVATRCLDELNKGCSSPVGSIGLDWCYVRDVVQRLLIEIELHRLLCDNHET